MTHEMLSPYRIRAALGQDSRALTQLALRSKAHWGYDEEFMAACRKELDCPVEKIQNNRFLYYVLIVGTEILGFYALERMSKTEVELEALFVEPDFIGQGYGRILLEHAKDNAAEIGMKTIVIQSDPHAEAFYFALGGIKTGVKKSASIPGRYLPLFRINIAESS